MYFKDTLDTTNAYICKCNTVSGNIARIAAILPEFGITNLHAKSIIAAAL